MGMFDKPTAVAAPAPKPKGKQKVEVEVRGIEELAMVDALQKALEGIRSTIEADVKGAALTRFLGQIKDTGTKPDSFKAVEGGASASLELRRKGSNIALSDAQVALIRGLGVEPAKETTVPKLYGINPQYAENAELLGKVEAALAGVVPPDFIVLQDERSKFTVTETVLDEALRAMRGTDISPDTLACMTVLAAKPRLVTTNLSAIFAFVQRLITPECFGEAAAEAQTVKLSVVKVAA